MELINPDNNMTAEEEQARIDELTALKAQLLSKFSAQTRSTVTDIIDELVCEIVFKNHMQLKLGVFDEELNRKRNPAPPEESDMAEELNAARPNHTVECPNCFKPFKCLGLTKHLVACMRASNSNIPYSGRNSSRVARQRIQAGFKTPTKTNEDEPVKPKQRKSAQKKKN